jgi:predicted dehydrogenase
MKLRVGLVGLGSDWEKSHRPALRTLSDRLEVIAVCDQVAMRAERAARDFDACVLSGYQAMVRRNDIDAILILSPQWFGSLPVLAACDWGKSVYCGAGLELDPPKSEQIRERVERSGIVFLAEFRERHAPATTRLKELIATKLGSPQLLFCHRREEAASPGTMESNGQDHLQRLIHLVDWCRYIVGSEPTSVVGFMHQDRSNAMHEDYQMMTLDFSPFDAPGTGVAAQISRGSYVPSQWEEAVAFRPPAAMQVTCENGIAFIDLPARLIWFDNAGRHVEALEHERPVEEICLLHFYRAVTSLVRNATGLEDAYCSLDIVLQSRLSHQQGHRIGLGPHASR